LFPEQATKNKKPAKIGKICFNDIFLYL
jgi:hypothetical protein